MISAEIKLPEKDAEMVLRVISKLGGRIKLIEPGEQKLSPAAKKMKKDLEQASKRLNFIRKEKFN